MPIQFACSCGHKLQAEEEHVGRLVRCPACGAETTVPGPEAECGEPESLSAVVGVRLCHRRTYRVAVG